jgi:hypothetical protein
LRSEQSESYAAKMQRWAAVACAALLFAAAASARQLEQDQSSGELISLPGRALLGDKDHKYKKGELVPLWASKVGPFTNPRCAQTEFGCRSGCTAARPPR